VATAPERTTAKKSASEEAAAHVRTGRRLGPFLCWAVVFADIGTSVYYTPGILYRQVGVHAALFVTMTLVVFVLLCVPSRRPTGSRRSAGDTPVLHYRAKPD
jgi:hypothetical protein